MSIAFKNSEIRILQGEIAKARVRIETLSREIALDGVPEVLAATFSEKRAAGLSAAHAIEAILAQHVSDQAAAVAQS